MRGKERENVATKSNDTILTGASFLLFYALIVYFPVFSSVLQQTRSSLPNQIIPLAHSPTFPLVARAPSCSLDPHNTNKRQTIAWLCRLLLMHGACRFKPVRERATATERERKNGNEREELPSHELVTPLSQILAEKCGNKILYSCFPQNRFLVLFWPNAPFKVILSTYFAIASCPYCEYKQRTLNVQR